MKINIEILSLIRKQFYIYAIVKIFKLIFSFLQLHAFLCFTAFLAKTHAIALRLKTYITKLSFLGGAQILSLILASTVTLEKKKVCNI